MKTKTKYLLPMVLLCLIFAVAAAAFPTFSRVWADNETAKWEEITVSADALVDDTFTLPSRHITVAGKQYEAEVKLRCPNGITLRKTDSFSDVEFEQAGIYTLVFEAKDDKGKRHKDEFEITVADKLWRVTDPKSSVSYGQHKLADPGVNGLLVRLAEGDTLTFNQIIDLSDLSPTDVLFSGFITPDTRGALDFERLFFTFTDVYDPDCTLTVSGRRSQSSSNWKAVSYWTAAGTGQYLAGLEGSKLHQNNQWGTNYMHSFVAQTDTADISANTRPFTIYFDADKMQVLDAQRTMIIDLDDPQYHEADTLWKGFTSGKVICSVTAQDYKGETANFCITSLYGYDLTSENCFVETDPPEITVDVRSDYVDASGNFIPQAVVGYSYPVPAASAFDAYSGAAEVKTTVYFNYEDPARTTTVPVSDGRFEVNKEGLYTIVYTAADAMGNLAEKVYRVTSVTHLQDPLSVSLDMTGVKTEACCGEKVTVAAAETSGGSGDAEIRITAGLDGTVFEITDGTFRPERAGIWTISYIATDYAGVSAEKAYAVKVEAGSVPVFADEPELPRYLISGVTYAVPEVYAKDYSSGVAEEKAASMVMVDIGGASRAYHFGETFTPIADENTQFVTLIFTVGEAVLEKDIPVVIGFDEDNFIAENMFVGTGFDTQKSDGGLTVTARQDGSFSWIYANAVAAENASVTVGGLKGKSDFDALKIVFIDYADPKISVTMYAENSDNGNLRILFGDTDRELSKGLASGGTFIFSYASGRFYVDNVGVTVAADDSGNPFSGFPSGRVYIFAEAVNAAAGSGYTVEKLDNMSITNLPRDRIKPRIAVSGEYGGMYAKDSEYVIPSAIATDTVDPNVAFSMTVRSPSGEIVTDIGGKLLSGVDPTVEYRILLSEFGQYKVDYTATDFSGNQATLSYAVNILDRTAPVVTVAKTWSATASVGEKVTLPEVTVSDDKSAAEDIMVYRTVRNPNGVLVVFGFDYTVGEDGQLDYTRYQFTYKYAGVYRFIVLAMDEAGNQTIVQYFVTVS